MSTTSVSQAWSAERPARVIGSVMFSIALSVGTRLKAWKMNPTRSRRSSVRSFSFSDDSSTSPMYTWPDVTSSSPAEQCMSVDFPEPDGPMMAVNRPFSKLTLTSSRARTSLSPDP